MSNGIVVAAQSFECLIDGVTYTVRAGTTVREGHPLLRDGRDHYFRPFTVDYEYTPPVKKATAAAIAKLKAGAS